MPSRMNARSGRRKTIWTRHRITLIFQTESYFELKGDNELKKEHAVFMADDNTDHSHVEEEHMADALNKLANTITSDATNLTNLTLTNTNMVEQIKVAQPQNKVLTYLPRKKYSVSQQLTQKTRTHINGNAPTRQGGVKIAQAHNKNNMIRSSIYGLMGINLM